MRDGVAAASPGVSASRPYRLLLTTWQDFGAGSVQSVQYLAEGLKERGHEVHVACPADGVVGRRLIAAGVPVVDLRFARGWSVHAARRIAELVRTHRIELIDAQESRDRKAAILARWIFRAPAKLVITRRQMTATFPPLNALYAHAADRVIAISNGVKRDLVRRGMPAARISVVHTGLDPRRLEGTTSGPEADGLYRELGLDTSLPTVGVVARRKDQETLLRAATILRRPLNLLFVGIDRDQALADLEPALPAGSRVVYTSFRESAVPFYPVMTVMTLTTLREGLSQAILESMGMGVPVISAAVGGTPEVVQDGVNGLLYPPGDAAALADAIRRVLDNEGLRGRLAAAGRATVAGPFHADRLVQGTEAVYRELLEGRTA